MSVADEIKRSPIGIGCAYLTDGSLTRYDDRLVAEALDSGATHFDVAPQYGLGTAEVVLGRVLAESGRRDGVTISTKVGIRRPAVKPWRIRVRALLGPVRKVLRNSVKGMERTVFSAPRELEFSPEYIRGSLEESLRLLRTDRVDAFLLHMPSREDVTDEVVKVLLDQKSKGKVRSVGIATERAESAAILKDWPGIFDVVQYSWCVLDSSLESIDSLTNFRITHRALARALGPLSRWLQEDGQRARRVADKCGEDLSDPAILAQALLGAAMVENAGGIILAASRSIARSKWNVETARAKKTEMLGGNFRAALRHEANLPSPRG